MTYEQFWDGDVKAHKQYRNAHKLKLKEQNTLLWLQGRYFYDALCAASPIIRAFSKAKRPSDYVKQPYDLDEEDRRKREEREQRKRYERMKEKVALFAAEYNRQRKDGDADASGNDGIGI